jgi:hypothetical protein
MRGLGDMSADGPKDGWTDGKADGQTDTTATVCSPEIFRGA